MPVAVSYQQARIEIERLVEVGAEILAASEKIEGLVQEVRRN